MRHKKRDSDAAGRKAISAGWERFLPLVIVAAGALAYHNSYAGVFLLDDEYHIVQNDRIRQLWPIRDLLNHSRPLVELSLAVNYALGGLVVRGYHAFNLIVHVLAGLALFGVVRRTLLLEVFGGRFERTAGWWSLVVSLIWVVHPLGTQSVTYVIQRGESMMGLFYLLTLYCAVRGARSRRPVGWYAGAVAACALGMGCKAVMVTAPLVVVFYDSVFLPGPVRNLWRRRGWFYLCLAGTWSIPVATGVARHVLAPPAGATVSLGFGYGQVTPWQYLLTQAEVLVHYLRLSLWPDPLCLDYAWPVARHVGEVALPAVGVVALLLVTVWALWRRWWLGFVGVWFFVILAPTSSFIPIKDVAFEHRMYLPLAGVVVVVVAIGMGVIRRICDACGAGGVVRSMVVAGVVTIVVSVLVYVTLRRNADYHSRLVMWSKVAGLRPGNSRAQLHLGNALFHSDLDRAIEAYELALALDDSQVQARHNLANAALKQGRLEDAIRGYREVVAVKPEYVRAYYNMGNALRRLGRRREAVEAYQGALEVDPGYHEARTNLGLTLAELGEFDEAIAEYERVLAADANHVGARLNLGAVLVQQGRLREAEAQYRAVTRIDPNEANAHHRLGVVLTRQGRFDEAIRSLRRALSLRPEDAVIRRALVDAEARRR